MILLQHFRDASDVNSCCCLWNFPGSSWKGFTHTKDDKGDGTASSKDARQEHSNKAVLLSLSSHNFQAQVSFDSMQKHFYTALGTNLLWHYPDSQRFSFSAEKLLQLFGLSIRFNGSVSSVTAVSQRGCPTGLNVQTRQKLHSHTKKEWNYII